MKMHYLALCFAPMIVLGWWAYSENYKTKAAIERLESLQTDIGKARETLDWLKAEWSYLDRPDNIEPLVDRFFLSDIQLVPLIARRLADISSIPFRQDANPSFDHETQLLLAAPIF